MARSRIDPLERQDQMDTISAPFNNGMQLTKAARCAPFAFRSWGQSLRAAFAADPGCPTGLWAPTDRTPEAER